MNRSALVKEKFNNDIFFTILMALIWADSILLQFIRVFLMKVPYVWQNADMLLSLIFIITLCLSLRAVSREVFVKELFYTLLIYGIFYLYYFLFPLNQEYYVKYADKIVKESFPMFLLGICVYRIGRERTIKVLYGISIVTVFAYMVYVSLFRIVDERTMRAGDMNAAYIILPHLCLVFAGTMRKPTVWNVGALVVGGVMLLFLGNRGSLLCLGIFVIFSILFSGKLKRPVLFLVLSVSIMLALFSFGLLDLLYEVADKNGFSLRIFEKLESGEISASSGRDKIKQRVWEYILLHPIIGMGIFSDRRVAGGHYAHNILYELMIHYGMVLGTILLILLIWMIVKTYTYLKAKEDRWTLDYFCALFFSSCLKLLLSSSYLMEPYFFLMLGFAFAVLKERKRTEDPDKKRTPKRMTLRRPI